ncbi:alpha/beta fold hydrolase [Mesorhizobium sp. IMUNJ 23232]|uniref:alpha/beta fold hydrolase n=1 Tax=Mesorhizobium sp. IMUNJ 23232 TaxID=3376064 RepID=UPI0037B81ABB
MQLTRRDFGLMGGASLCLALARRSEAASPSLFPGEELINAAGFPSLVKYIKGRPDRPLVVFVPGTSFLARISYGFPGGRPADFLAHWIVEEGYSFLGTSYPLDHPAYRQVYPEFNVTDWGRQIAAGAQRAIAANGLGNRIIVVGWSMGGKPVQTVADAARAAGLDLALFVALDALPPGPNLFPGNAEQFTLAPDGMVDQAHSLMPWFIKMMAKQNEINARTIIPEDIFRADFTGNPPLDIQGENARFRNGRIVSDPAAAAADAGTSRYDSYPAMALMISDSTADYPNVLLCRSNWGELIAQQLYRAHVYPHRERLAGMTGGQWKALQDLFKSAMDRLTVQIHGTHFLFVGEHGARAAAKGITELAERAIQLDREIDTVLRTR